MAWFGSFFEESLKLFVGRSLVSHQEMAMPHDALCVVVLTPSPQTLLMQVAFSLAMPCGEEQGHQQARQHSSRKDSMEAACCG